nr:dynein axonemal intermediate chain 1-like [Cherax quadricarinatus]
MPIISRFPFGDEVAVDINTEVQTDQPPGTSFSQTVSFSSVYDAYEKDHSLTLLEKQKEVDKEQGHDIMVGIIQRRISLTLATTMTPPLAEDPDKPSFNLPGLHQAAMILERMVNQNIYDDIIQDFMYWEDGGDDYHPLEGSLLPLWKFATDTSRSLVVSDVCWSPVYRDLFAASYTTGEVDGAEEGGMVCLFTLKNPSTPERTFRSQCGVTCVHFHPKYGSMVGAGWSDGTVVVYDVSSLQSPLTIYSSPVNGKHLLPVTRVRWVETDVEAGLSLFSVSLDGRVTQWQVTTSALLPSGVLDFTSDGLPTFNRRHSAAARARFHGKGTCIAFKPDDVSEVLVGVDNGCVYQMSTSCPTYTLTRYPAHTASVRAIAWNNHHHQVFISCSLDWTVKIWLQYYLSSEARFEPIPMNDDVVSDTSSPTLNPAGPEGNQNSSTYPWQGSSTTATPQIQHDTSLSLIQKATGPDAEDCHNSVIFGGLLTLMSAETGSLPMNDDVVSDTSSPTLNPAGPEGNQNSSTYPWQGSSTTATPQIQHDTSLSLIQKATGPDAEDCHNSVIFGGLLTLMSAETGSCKPVGFLV